MMSFDQLSNSHEYGSEFVIGLKAVFLTNVLRFPQKEKEVKSHNTLVR